MSATGLPRACSELAADHEICFAYLPLHPCFYLLPPVGPAASAQYYPAHKIRMVVPFPAGGSIDIVSRSIAQRWSPHLGQQFVIDNRAGAAGTTIQGSE